METGAVLTGWSGCGRSSVLENKEAKECEGEKEFEGNAHEHAGSNEASEDGMEAGSREEKAGHRRASGQSLTSGRGGRGPGEEEDDGKAKIKSPDATCEKKSAGVW